MRVVVVGDVAVDVLVTPSAPAVPGADVPARIRTVPGGAGANTAAWLAHLGARVTLVARVGDDPAGRAVGAGLPGVDLAVTIDPHAPTATVVVLLDGDRTASPDGVGLPDRTGPPDRTMLSDRGAAAHLCPADLPALDGADHLHLSGYVLLDPSSRPAGLAALAAARAAGLSTSVDPQAAPALTPRFLGWVRGVDVLLPNADELAALGPGAAAAVGAVAATAGDRGASWTDARGTWVAPAVPAVVHDVTGAGDAFDAGLLVSWLAGAGPEAALRAGCAAGAAAVARPGGRPGRP